MSNDLNKYRDQWRRERVGTFERRVRVGLLLGVVLVWLILVAAHANSAVRKRPDLRVMLAASCVGEAGWESHRTGECAAIMHIYKKQAHKQKKSMRLITRLYSSALKTGRRGWLNELSADASRPPNWPSNASWAAHRAEWVATLEHVRLFMRGYLADPTPAALHYGGAMDDHRARAAGWCLVPKPDGFVNNFWGEKCPGK